MKRLLLLLFLFLISNVIFSQKAGHYIINYNVNIKHSRPGNICYTNYTYITAYTKNNKEIRLSEFKGSGFGPVYIRDSTKIIDIEDKITSIRFQSKLNDRKGDWPCFGSDKSDRRSPVALSDYPCVTKSISNFINEDNYTVYDNFNAIIAPKAYLSFTKSKKDTKKRIVCNKNSVKLYASEGFDASFKNKIYKWEFLDPVNVGSRYTAEFQALLDQVNYYENQFINCLSSGGDEGEPLRVPKEEDLSNEKATSFAAVPIDGGDCSYWYDLLKRAMDRVSNYTGTKTEPVYYWRPITSKDGKSEIDLSLSDLFSNEADQKKALNNKKISIRLNPSCSGEKDISNIVEIQFLPEPPKAAQDPTFNPPKCSSDEIEGFTLYFERQLYENETINIYLEKEFKNGTFEVWDQNSSIIKFDKVNNNLYKYSWVKKSANSIIDGNYKIKVFGYRKNEFGNLVQNCTELEYPKDLKNGKEIYSIKTPDPLTFTAEVVQEETCFGANDGKIKITASGGHEFVFSTPTPPLAPIIPDPIGPIDPVDPIPAGPVPTSVKNSYQYSLDDGVTWSTDSFDDFIIIDGLSPKEYHIRVRDKNSCISDPEKIIKTTIAKQKITHDVSIVKHPSAPGEADGEIRINSVEGGTSINGVSYNFEVYDSSNQIIKTSEVVNGDSGKIITDLPAGAHKIVYTDKNKCTQEYTLPEIIDPKPISFIVNSLKPDCYLGKGKINVTNISGGYPNYTVFLKRGSTVINTKTGVTTNTSFDIEAGSYTVLVKDNRQGSLEKSIDVIEQAEIVISNVNITTPIKCNGQNAIVNVTAIGGKSNEYQYAIYTGSGLMWQDSNEFSLPASSVEYRFIARDKHITNCLSKVSSSVSITQPLPIEIISNSVKHNNIYGDNKGEILLDIDGGIPNYTVNWTKRGDANFSKTGNPATRLEAGFYTATVSDSSGDNDCNTVSNEIEVKENPELSGTLAISKIIACNGGVGSLKVTPSGGSNNYSYKWFKGSTELIGETTNQLTNIGKGNYSVTINDGFTSISRSISLTEPSAITLNITKTDISCNGVEDGKIKLAIGGGTPPYEYSIDDQTSFQTVSSLADDTIEGLTSGSFAVWIRDSNRCLIEKPSSVTITEPTKIEITNATVTNCETEGGNEGAIIITTSGGEGTHTYEWTKEGNSSFTMNTKNINNLSAGIYHVVIRDAKGCEVTQLYEVKEPQPIQVVIKQTKTILCNGEETGELLAEVTGGYPINSTVIDFDYRWYDVTSGTPVLLNSDIKLNQINNLKAGSYRVVVNDIKGATTQNEVTINQPLKIEVNLASSTNVSCFGGEDGSIDITILGGTKPYSFSWKSREDSTFNKTTEDITELREGSYYVEITDGNGCTFTSSNFMIEQPLTALEISSYTVNNLTGFETENGSISVHIVGGTPNYTYEWRQKGNTAILGITNPFENIEAGEYELTVKDANGCITTGSYTVTEPDLLVVDAINQQGDILCFGDNNVSLTAGASGGVPPYSYSWKLKGGVVELGTMGTLSNIGAGIYIITITDKNGNVATKEYEVTEPSKLEIIGVNKGDVSCYGGTDGFIDVSVSGGTAPYTYSWKHGVIGSSLNSLEAGTYEVVVRDKNLCEVTRKITIQEPIVLAIDNSVIKDVTGFGLSNGEISINVVGGTLNYGYEWKDSSGIVQSSTTSELSGIKAGEYLVKVTDAKGCQIETTYTVNEPELLTVSISDTSILCKNGTGILTAKVNGGVIPYTYSWKLKGNVTVLSTSNVLEDVEAGIYEVTVIDENGNIATEEHELTEPSLLEITEVNKVDAACYGGADGYIDITVSGGVAPYTYSWEHTSLDAKKVENLSSGTYSVFVTDKNGCKTEKEIIINQPEKYDITNVKLIRPSSNLVDDGSVEVIFVGGVAPYTFEWKNETGNVISTKLSADLSDKIDNLPEGIYTITIKDSEGCVIEETYNLASPGELLVEITQVQEVKCHNASNGILDVITVGGVGGNNYAWYDADSNELLGTEKQLKNISAGNYYVIVNNVEGIEEKSSIFTVSEPTEVQLTIREINLSCFNANDGSFEVEVQGGTGDYEFRYRDASSFSDWISAEGTTIKVNSLEKNTYTLQVRDANNCLALNTDGNSDFTIEINQPLPLSVSNELIEEVTGFGLSNGSISVEIAGGTSPYTYEWKDSLDTTILTDNNKITSIPAGNYQLIVTDSKGCTLIKDYEVNQPLKLEVTIVKTSVISCNGEEDGVLKSEVIGGVSGYTYKWYKELSTPLFIGESSSVSGLGAGTYYVEIEDSKGNKVTSASYELRGPEALGVTFASSHTLCGTGNDWTVQALVNGGTAPYTYLWNTGDNESMLQDVVSESYSVVIVDANGCRVSNSIELIPPTPISTISEVVVNPTCYQGNDGSIRLEVIGGTPPYEYTWSNSDSGSVIDGLTSGEYDVVIKDSKGCFITKSFIVEDPESIQLDLGADVTLCVGQTYILDATIIDGVSYSWSSTNGFISNDAIVEVSESGVYKVKAINSLGCEVTSEIEVIDSGKNISSDFISSSVVYTDESFVLVNISDPQPDSVLWIYPEKAKVIEENNNFLEILIEDEGEYEVTLVTKVGNCQEFKTKKILVDKKDNDITEAEGNVKNQLINLVNLYPNPSYGDFKLDIELSKEAVINVRFYKLDGTIIEHVKYSGKEIYNLNYNFNLASGTYFASIETNKERIVKKIIIR